LKNIAENAGRYNNAIKKHENALKIDDDIAEKAKEKR